MAEPDDHDLILFMLGQTSPEQERSIQAQAQSDEEFAAKLRVLQSFVGTESEAMPGRQRLLTRLMRLLRNKKSVLAASILLLMIGVSWAGYVLLAPSPLLQDDFRGRWFNASKWNAPRRIVRQENGHLRLINRGAIVTQKEFPGPISISFRWRWLDLAGDPLYADHLTIALRTRGFFSGERPFEIQDGILIRLNAWGGTASIFSATDPAIDVIKPLGSAPLPADMWHDIRITDDGQRIALYIHGPEIPEQPGSQPFLSLLLPAQAQEYHVAIYNRELLADVVHESHIDDFRLDRLQP